MTATADKLAADIAASTRPVKVVVSDVQHFVGARPTRTTWTATVELADGTRRDCGHHAHPTTGHAVACGKRLWRRMDSEWRNTEESK